MKSDVFLNRGFTFQCPAWKSCELSLVLLTKARSVLALFHDHRPVSPPTPNIFLWTWYSLECQLGTQWTKLTKRCMCASEKHGLMWG